MMNSINAHDSNVEDEVNILEEVGPEQRNTEMAQALFGKRQLPSQNDGNNQATSNIDNVMKMIRATGSTTLNDAISRSPKTKVTRPSKVIHLQQQQQQLNQSNTQNLQAIITPQGLPGRKLVQTTQHQYITDNHQQIILAKSSQGNAGTVAQRRQPTLKAGNITNQTIILNQQRQLLQQQIQSGHRVQDANTNSRIMEILAHANVPQEQKDNTSANNLPATVTSTSGAEVQALQNTMPVSSSQLVCVKTASGSVAEIKNTSSPKKLQVFYKPDVKELTQADVDTVTRQLFTPNSQPTSQIIRQKILSPQSASQVVRLAQQGQQQSAVVQTQGGTPRQILVQGNSVVLQRQQQPVVHQPRKASQQAMTVGSQQVQIVPQARTQQWLGYQQQQQLQAQQKMQTSQQQQVQHQQQQLQAQQKMQTSQQQQVQHQQQLQVQQKMQTSQQQQVQHQQQIRLQQVQQQQHVVQNHQQVELQSQQLKNVQGTLVSDHGSSNPTAIQSNTQYVDSSGQVIQLSHTGKQIYLTQQSPVTSSITRNVNQFAQNSGQTVYSRTHLQVRQTGNPVVRVIPPNQHRQQSKMHEINQGHTVSQTGQMTQNGLVVRNTPYSNNEQYQQHVRTQARKNQQPTSSVQTFQQIENQNTAAMGLQGISQQQQQQQKPLVVTLGSQSVESAHSHTSYPQNTSTMINTQSNNGLTATSQVAYQTTRPGLAQLKAAYGQNSPRAQQMVQIVQANRQTQQRTSAAMASTFAQEVKNAVASSTGRPPQSSYHTVLASPEDSPPTTPMQPPQVHQQQVANVQQVVPEQKALIVLHAGEDVSQCLNTLAVGTQVIVKRPDNASIPAVWNGKTITLNTSFPAASLNRKGEIGVSGQNEVTQSTQVQPQMIMVAPGSQGVQVEQQQCVMSAPSQGQVRGGGGGKKLLGPASKRLRGNATGLHMTSNSSSVETVVGGGGGSHTNHPITGKEKLTRRPLHPEGQESSDQAEESSKATTKKRPQKPTEAGKWALCNNCGMQSADYNVCEGCLKEMPDEPKYTFDKNYGGAKKTKLDIGETSGSECGKMIILNKGMALDKKAFYSKHQGEMQFLVTDGGGKHVRKVAATKSPLIPRVLAKNQGGKRKRPPKKSSEPEVVSILSSDEEDPGNADGSMPNVNPSPTGSRSNTPVQGGRKKQRMEDKMTIPTFVEFGTDIKKIDETARSRFLWEWMDVEIIIEYSGGRYKHKIGDAIRKTVNMGEVYCLVCRKVVNYGSRGKTTVVDHCKRQDHLGNVLLHWQESGMETNEAEMEGICSQPEVDPPPEPPAESTPSRKSGKGAGSKGKKPAAKKAAPSPLVIQYTGPFGGSEMNLDVRSVRIGSLKSKPFDNCLVSKDGFNFKIQHDGNRFIEIEVGSKDVEQLIAHFGDEIPVIFIYTTPGCALRIRNLLNMKSDEGPYFDPGSKVEAQKRLVLEMHPPGEDQALDKQFNHICKSMQQGRAVDKSQFLTLIDRDSAEKILETLKGPEEREQREEMKYILAQHDGTQISIPWQEGMEGKLAILVNGERVFLNDYSLQTVRYRNSDDDDDEPVDRSRSPSPPHAVFNGPIIRLFIYPPPPKTGGIQVSNEDLFCLNEGEFLNDVIIDFYLKYLYLDVLKEEDRERTHIFSSFFYRRLTQRSKRNEDPNQTPQQRRHSRVRTWTRHVDLFQKDFIIVPINESAHWYLAIICFPGLEKPEPWSSPPPKQEIMPPIKVDDDEEFDQRNKGAEAAPPAAVPSEENVSQEAESSPPAEAAGEPAANGASSQEMQAKAEKETLDEMTKGPREETKMETSQDGEENMDCDDAADSESGSAPDIPTGYFGFKKRPCILVFDSLAGPSRNAVIRTLREYLQVEWDTKKASTVGERVFDKDFIKGANPKCPQQTNFSDCGIYLLQYVKSFYEMPIVNYAIPMRALENWFPEDYVMTKRDRLRDLILSLQKQLNPSLEYDPAQDLCL